MTYSYRNPALAGPADPFEAKLVHPAVKNPPGIKPGSKVVSPHPKSFPVPVAPRGMLRGNFTARNLNDPAAEGVRPEWMAPGMPYQGFRGLGELPKLSLDSTGSPVTYVAGPTVAQADAGAPVTFGMKGPAVAEMQRMLTAVGSPPAGGVDGFYGRATKNALETWLEGGNAAVLASVKAAKAQGGEEGAVRVAWRALRQATVSKDTGMTDATKAGVTVVAVLAAGLALWKLT